MFPSELSYFSSKFILDGVHPVHTQLLPYGILASVFLRGESGF